MEFVTGMRGDITVTDVQVQPIASRHAIQFEYRHLHITIRVYRLDISHNNISDNGVMHGH